MAMQPAPLTIAENLQRIARDIHDMAFDFMEPATSHREVEARIARVEDLADRLRSIVRGTPIVRFAQSCGQIAEALGRRKTQ